MVASLAKWWGNLDRWSSRLFILAAVFLLVSASNSGMALLFDGYTFNEWLGIVLELGRLAALLGTAGLSVALFKQNARLGALSRVVVILAIVFVAVLIAVATLQKAGILANQIGVIGICAYVLSVSTFALFGVGIIRTGAYSTRIGGLLVATVVALLVVFFGRLVVPLELLATVVPGIQVLLYLDIGYRLRVEHVSTQPTSSGTDTLS